MNTKTEKKNLPLVSFFSCYTQSWRYCAFFCDFKSHFSWCD